MIDDAVSGPASGPRIAGEPVRRGIAGTRVRGGLLGQVLFAATRLYPVPPACVTALLVAGVVLGALADGLLRAPGPPGLNLSLWIAAVAMAALVLHRRGALVLDRTRVAWLVTGVVCAAGLAWRDAPPLKLLALGCATLAFAIAAHRPDAAWARRAGVMRYAGALALGALHGWTAALLAVADKALATRRAEAVGADGRHGAAAVARGLLIAIPLVAVFGALFMSADAMFERLVLNIVRFDVGVAAGHVLLFSVGAWLATGYLRGFLTGTAVPPLGTLVRDPESAGLTPGRLRLGITEIVTTLGALDLLFLVFVIVQFRYLFGGDTLVHVTPDLTYADYARRGFFELVFAVALVVPVLLVADWLLERRRDRDNLVFRGLAGVQLGLVLAIAASAFQRLRLYYDIYGLTESRLYATVLLVWMGVVLCWFGVTVLRGRRESFAFGALASGFVTVALLFVVNPDAVITQTNVERMEPEDTPIRFDIAYATSLSADAVPGLIAAMPSLPGDVQCPLARQMLRRWPPDRERSIRSWNWAVARASDAVREHETQLRSMLGPGQKCAVANLE